MQKLNSERRVCLFGASPDTGNRGVTALCHSVVWHLHNRGVRDITVFDHGRGVRKDVAQFGESQVPIRLCGAIHSRRYHRPDSLWNIRLSAWAQGALNPAARRICQANAILDVSAGDSFTDLYGPRRFQSVVLPKLIALDAGRPLILMPQTYGPFQSARAKQTAAHIVQRAAMAWARDTDSFLALRELLGQSFDPQRHRCGVDMAFALPAVAPRELPPLLVNWLNPVEREKHEVIGFNVSGLIYNQPELAEHQFGLRTNYRELVHRFLTWLLATTSVRIVLVPHVLTAPGHPESDYDAACQVIRQLPSRYRDRIAVCCPQYSPSELKWIISRTQWFAGTRMHSTIAALSSGVPTSAASYSLKTRGVFASCGQAHQVCELRHCDTDDTLYALQSSFLRRDIDRHDLSRGIPAVIEAAREELDTILDFIAEPQQCTGNTRNVR